MTKIAKGASISHRQAATFLELNLSKLEFLMAHRAQIVASLTLGLVFSFTGNLAHAATDQYYGRWAVSDDKPAYSSKGILFKTIDIAPCGEDVCGISVADDDSCGKTLFRFLAPDPAAEELVGHAKWGKTKKKLQIVYDNSEGETPYMYLGLGAEDMDIAGRESSIPAFEADYNRHGEVACTTE